MYIYNDSEEDHGSRNACVHIYISRIFLIAWYENIFSFFSRN